MKNRIIDDVFNDLDIFKVKVTVILFVKSIVWWCLDGMIYNTC